MAGRCEPLAEQIMPNKYNWQQLEEVLETLSSLTTEEKCKRIERKSEVCVQCVL